MYYNTCEYCGAYLDPCEKCDCSDALADEVIIALDNENTAYDVGTSISGKFIAE